MPSRLGLRTLDATLAQSIPQASAQCVKPAVDVKRRGEAHDLANLAGGQAIVEVQFEEEPVARIECADRCLEGASQLARAQLRFRIVGGRVGDHLGSVQVVREEIYKAPPD